MTLEDASAEKQFRELLKALDELEDTFLIFTMPNSDTDSRVIIKMIDEYVSHNLRKSISFVSMGQLNYLSLLQYVDAVVGNSSSGIIEAPYFKIGTINIGDRQKGRIRAESVIDCLPSYHSISDAVKYLYSDSFSAVRLNVTSPYGDGKAAGMIFSHICSFIPQDTKKKFYDY